MLTFVCCAAFGLTGSCAAEDETATEEVLKYESGILTDLSTTSPIGILAETVRFTPPREPWTLTRVQVAGWNGFDNETLPPERLIYLEIRDEDLNLLYQFADSQIPYFTDTSPVMSDFEIPALTVSGDFYVCFYDRGALGVAFNATDSDEDTRSYRYNRFTRELLPAKVITEESGESVSINWLIRAVGN